MPRRPTPGAAADIRRVRALRERGEREATGLCYVEGIRQVMSALEGGHAIDTVLVDPARLRSDVGWEAVARAQAAGARLVTLTTHEFERVSARDNPAGLAAVVAWRPSPLGDLRAAAGAFYLAADDIHDPGNLGTLVRTADGAGCAAVIVSGGVDPAHPTALRSSLGTAFRLPVYAAESLDAVFAWATAHHVTTVATTEAAAETLWDAEMPFPAVVLVGNEGEGLPAMAIDRADVRLAIPMRGTATSLNVSVAAGIVLYELVRRELTHARPSRDDGLDA